MFHGKLGRRIGYHPVNHRLKIDGSPCCKDRHLDTWDYLEREKSFSKYLQNYDKRLDMGMLDGG